MASFYEEKIWWTKWQDEDVVINDSAARTVDVDDLLKLDTLWNAQNYNSSNLSSGDGTYRVYVALQDNAGNVLSDSDGDNLMATFNFTLDNAAPFSIALNAPDDDASVSDMANNISFNWTVMDSLDSSLTCNLTIDGVVEGENVVSANATMANYTVNDLAVGDHAWNVTCWDDASNSNTSEMRNVSVYVSNTAPDTPVVSINFSGSENITSENVLCNAVISDADFNNLNVSVDWYLDGNYNISSESLNVASGSSVSLPLLSGNTTKHNDWSCAMRIYDGTVYSDWVNTTNVTVLNDVPVVTLSLPTDKSSTINRAPEFTWTVSDDDGDTITYDWNLTDYKFSGAGACSDSREETDLSSATFTPTSDLTCLYDNGYYYTWRVRANDSEGYGGWSDYYIVNITAEVGLKLLLADLDFGNMGPEDANDTSDDSPLPIKIENNGTVVVNVSVNADALWVESPDNSSYYQFKADNVTSEPDSFNWLSSIVSWFNVPITGSAVAINQLNYADSADSAEIDIRVEVPLSEIPAAKSSSIVFTAQLAE